MSKIVNWYQNNSIQISWFVIGWLTADGLSLLGRGDFNGGMLSLGLAALNYFLARR